MAFTHAQLNATLTYPEQVTAFVNNSAGTYTDVYCQNMYSTANAAIRANLS